MTFVFIFAFSGIVIVLLSVSKKLEEIRKRPFFISKLISKGDIHIREIYHRIVHLYSDGKEKIIFFVQKQMPMHLKNLFNKSVTFLKEKREQYTNNMRNSRLIKKNEGISEFFKNMSDLEKGNGEINDVFTEDSQNDSEKSDLRSHLSDLN